MNPRICIISGASRGLGAALAEGLAAPGTELVLIGRSSANLQAVQTRCVLKGASVRLVAADLADAATAAIVSESLSELPWASSNEALLINNAGQIGPIRKLQHLHPQDIDRHVELNLVSTFWLTGAFLRFVAQEPTLRAAVLNISSGVSLKPLTGWSLYCATKAAMNTLALSIAEETRDWPAPVRAVAINPGPIDTEMQREIRSATADEFPALDRFVQLHHDGKLVSPADVAAKVLAVLEAHPFPQGQFVDLKDR